MKAYLYNTENGIYEGETFEETDMIQYDEGITTVPPPDYKHGQVAVFDQAKEEWAVIPASVARQLLNISTSNATEKTS